VDTPADAGFYPPYEFKVNEFKVNEFRVYEFRMNEFKVLSDVEND
jgi:hypothetical protein